MAKKQKFWKLDFKKRKLFEKIIIVLGFTVITLSLISGIAYASSPKIRDFFKPKITENQNESQQQSANYEIKPRDCPEDVLRKDGTRSRLGYKLSPEDVCAPRESTTPTTNYTVQSGCPLSYSNKMYEIYETYVNNIYNIYSTGNNSKESAGIAWQNFQNSNDTAYKDMLSRLKESGCPKTPSKITKTNFSLNFGSTTTPPTTPPPVTCSDSKRSSIISQYNYKVEDENKRYEDELDAIAAECARRGITQSGICDRYKITAYNNHIANLDNLFNQVTQELASSNCIGL